MLKIRNGHAISSKKIKFSNYLVFISDYDARNIVLFNEKVIA